MKNIIIKSIEEKQHDDVLEVIYHISIRGNEHILTYKISGEKIDGIPLLCDAVVVSLLAYAVKFGLSFSSKYPISEKLYYNLIKHVIPQLSLSNKTENDMISINMPLTKETYHGNWVGTGISLGVDSFATIHEYKEKCELEDYKLTHLVHLKTGAHHGQLGYYNQQKEDELFLIENAKVKKFCEEQNYKLVVIESNLYAVTCTEFGHGFDTTHTFRNLGCILLLQNLFSKYYYASAYNLDAFEVNLNIGVAHYEKWVIPYISNESVNFYSANTNLTRFQKTEFISKFKDSYDNLHVCWSETNNCCRCKKCIRTMVSLDVLGALNNYAKSFDLDFYYSNRDALVSEVIILRYMDSFYMEIYKAIQERNFKRPSKKVFAKVAIRIAYQRIKKLGLGTVLKTIKRKVFAK